MAEISISNAFFDFSKLDFGIYLRFDFCFLELLKCTPDFTDRF